MRHRLTGSFTCIETDIKTMRVQFGIQSAFYPIDEFENRQFLCASRGKLIFDNASSNNECMPWRNWKPIVDRERKFVGSDP